MLILTYIITYRSQKNLFMDIVTDYIVNNISEEYKDEKLIGQSIKDLVEYNSAIQKSIEGNIDLLKKRNINVKMASAIVDLYINYINSLESPLISDEVHEINKKS